MKLADKYRLITAILAGSVVAYPAVQTVGAISFFGCGGGGGGGGTGAADPGDTAPDDTGDDTGTDDTLAPASTGPERVTSVNAGGAALMSSSSGAMRAFLSVSPVSYGGGSGGGTFGISDPLLYQAIQTISGE